MNEHISKLGFKAKDKVTGFNGVISSVSFDLYGCIQYAIQPDSSDGEYKSSYWFDENRVVLTSKKRVMDLPAHLNETLTGDFVVKGAAEKPSL